MEKTKTLLKRKGRGRQGYDEAFKDDGYVHYVGCDNSFMVDTYVKIYQIVHFCYV